MHRWRTAALAGHSLQYRLEAGEAGNLARQLGEREPAARQQIERGAVRPHVHPEGAEHPQLLVDDVVWVEAGDVAATAGTGYDDRAAGSSERDRLGERGGRLRRHVNDDVRESSGRGAEETDGVIGGDVDGQVGAEPRRHCQPASVGRPDPGHHDEARAGVLGCRAREQSPHAGAEHGHDLTGLHGRKVGAPPDPSTERVEQCRHDRVQPFGHR